MRRIQNVYEYIILILFLMNSGCPLGSLFYNYITVISFVFCVIGLLVFKKGIKLNKISFLFIILLISSMILTMVVNLDNDYSHYIGKFLVFITVLVFANSVESSTILRKYILIILVICLYSIVLTVLLYIRFNPLVSLVRRINYTGENGVSSSRIGYLYYIWTGYGPHWLYFPKNSAFFREPGVFSTHVCIAMMIVSSDLFQSERKRKTIIMLVLFFGGLSSISTVGVLGSALLFLFYMKKQKSKYTKYILIGFSLIIIGYFLFANYSTLFDKLTQSSILYGSVSDRTRGMQEGMSAWFENPVFGKGYSYFQSHSNGVSSFFIPEFLGKYGIVYTLLFCISVYLFMCYLSSSRLEFWVFFAVYSMFLVTQGLVDMPVFLLFQLFSLKRLESKQKKLRTKEFIYEDNVVM